MANILTNSVALPATTKVSVDFYDDINRDLLFKSPAGAMYRDSHFPKILEVPTVELLTYYLFYKKRPGAVGYSSYQEIKPKYRNALVEFDGIVKFTGNSICVTAQDALKFWNHRKVG